MVSSLFRDLLVPYVDWAGKMVVFVVSPLTFAALFFIAAPFGKHEEGSSGLWGFRVNARLAWLIMEMPNFVAAPIFLFGAKGGSLVNAFFLSLFLLHYVNRTLIYPFRARLVKPMPFFVMMFAFVWTLFNGFCHGLWLGYEAQLDPSSGQFLLGVALFFLGLSINWESDEILMNLRKPGDSSYSIPRGSLFEYVTSPNYFGETLEWFGLAVASNFAWPSVAFAVYTFANLFPRAYATHTWYKKKFGKEYPPERKIFFPLLL